MSQPNIPNITPAVTLSRTESIDLIIASIALEELALAHIINAEAEKIQYVVGTLSGLSPAATVSNLLAINESVNTTLQTATQKQMYLQNKLKNVLQAPSLTGPTGPVGPTGPAGGGANLDQLELQDQQDLQVSVLVHRQSKVHFLHLILGHLHLEALVLVLLFRHKFRILLQ
ncbi:hypothetical protein [Bacillus thuringiensis]|uniref:hypothetical protein n=1 Tax=Bacillus thuringiensis TaxID=1428 RepID=UPI0023EEC00E|nr:hypothetical protein [Bacillus thuringiensis]